MIKVELVIPTLGRTEKLLRCVRSIMDSNIEWVDLRIKIVQDNRRLKAFGVWNEYFVTMDVDVMAYICDDIEFEQGALERACRSFVNKFPDNDGVMGLNQVNIPRGKEGFSASAMGFIGKKFAERYPNRTCFCTDYSSFHADAELGIYARELHKFFFAETAGIIHYHPAHCPNEKDNTHQLVRVPEVVAMDRKVWNERQRLGLLWGRDKKLVGRNLI